MADKAALNKFYFSQSSSFQSFKGAHERQAQPGAAAKHAPSPTPDPASTPGAMQRGADDSALTMSAVDVSMPSTIQDVSQAAGASPDAAGASAVVAKVGISGLRKMTQPKAGKKAGAAQPNAASAEYFAFLKQQQDLQNHHARLEEALAALQTGRQSQQSALSKMRRQASELLGAIEASTDWKLRSRYDLAQLGRDCTLTLQPVELVEDKAPVFDGVEQLGARLEKIKDEFKDTAMYQRQALLVEQGVRRMGLLSKILADGNMDSNDIARIPDTLVIQLEKVCQLPTLESLVTSSEGAIDKLVFQTDEARLERQTAISNGEVHVAEQAWYEIIDHYEEMLTHVNEKADVLERATQETQVLETIRASFHDKTFGEFDKIRNRSSKLKERCEGDIKKMFALREKVEEVEAATAVKVVEERTRSDTVLTDNVRKQEAVFGKMEALEQELVVLEKERHREVQKRIAEKDKDEHRRAEFSQFCAVVDDHLVPVERTIANMDIAAHSVDVVNDFTTHGFKSIEDELAERLALLKDVALEAHKQHVEVFRGMLMELGEMAYKKERMIDETDKSIQQAHIQQELLAETFNPNAKKFGDVKKRLLANRDELEGDIGELKERAAAALKGFARSELALSAAGVDYVHPVTEQEHHTLMLKARMMEVKALAAGHTEGQAVMADISTLKAELNESRQNMTDINQATSGTISKTLPMIRAAEKVRQKQ
jgi:hypothetical protein